MAKTVIPSRKAYSIGEVSLQTSLSKGFLRKEVNAGRLKVRRFGRRVVVLADDLDLYLNRQASTDIE